MAKSNVTEELAQAIESLQTRREALLKEIEEIDQTFEKFGIDAGAALPSSRGRGKKKRGRGRPRGSKTTTKKAGKKTGKKTTKKTGKKVSKRGRRKKGTFTKTGEQTILDFVREHGSPSTAEINVHWSGEGRGGKADNTITRLVKEGKLARVENPGERGSRYKLA